MNLLTIPTVKNNVVVPAIDIIRIQASSNYSCIYFANGKKMVVAKILNWFEENLPAEMFSRVHRSHLVNKKFIQQINADTFKNLLLLNGEMITISRRRKRQIKEGFILLDSDTQLLQPDDF